MQRHMTSLQFDRHRHGVAYMLVLFALLIGTALAVSFMTAAGTSSAIANNVRRHSDARAIAESGLEMAIAYVRSDETWRDDKTSGQWLADQDLNGGTFSIWGEDDDGDLADDTDDPVRLTVVATYEGVTHRVSALVTPGESTDAGELLFVCGDADSMSSADQKKQDFFESLGYSVNALTDSANQAAYDTALETANVVYVSEQVSSSSVGTKLLSVPVGVVVEEALLHDDMEFSSSSGGTYSDTNVYITDNGHYITQQFSTGNVTLTESTETFARNASTLASGAHVLGTNSNPALFVFDVGAQLYDGSSAQGRRVAMPFGASNFDFDQLTDDGETLVQRALEWAAASQVPANGLLAEHFHSGSGDPYPVSNLDELDDIDWTRTPDYTEYVQQINYASTSGSFYSGGPTDDFGVRFSGFIEVPTGGNWTFYIDSDDGSDLWIDGSLVVDNDGLHGMNEESGTISLTAGQHEIEARVFERGGGVGIILSWSGPSQSKQVVPASAFSTGAETSEDSGDTPQLVALYKFEETVVQPVVVGHWKLDDALVASGLNVLFVSSSGSNPPSVDDEKADVIESFGHTVNFIDDDDSQGTFDNAAAANDVVYVSEQVSSGSIAGKLPNFTIGIVLEERLLLSELGISNGSTSTFTSTRIDVVDDSHYITSPYSTGNLTIQSNDDMSDLTGTLAGGAQVLAERQSSSNAVLVALQQGEALYGGGDAPGRRVAVPWATGSFDVDQLNNNGENLFNRSLIWAAAQRAADDAAGANHGVVVNGATVGASGQIGTAIHFDGDNDLVVISNDSTLNLHSDFTICGWFKLDNNFNSASATSQIIMSKYQDNEHDMLVVLAGNDYNQGSVADGSLVFKIEGGETTEDFNYIWSSRTSWTAGQWYHFACVLDSNHAPNNRIYINGVDNTGGLDNGVGSDELSLDFNADMTIGGGAGDTSQLSGDRFFDGVIDDVRLYGQVMSDSQIAELAAATEPTPDTVPIAYDTSGYGTALDLEVEVPDNVEWLAGNGIEITSATRLLSLTTATKLYNALTATNELSIEVIFTPANTSQSGPARIVSYSGGASTTNVTFGQDGDEYITRLRTDTTFGNGTPSADSGPMLAGGVQEHVIVSYDGENITMYNSNGTKVSLARTGDLDWNNAFNLILGNESEDGYAWLGQLFRVAIYDQAFDPTQAGNVFDGNPPGSAAGGSASGFGVVWEETP